jgi:hypothetical protein
MTRRTLLTDLMASPVWVGPAETEGLPPLPQPGQPAEQVLRALIAWHGGVASAIVALTQGLDQEVSDYVDDEQHNCIKPLLERLEDGATGGMMDEAVYEARIRDACEKYGYVK